MKDEDKIVIGTIVSVIIIVIAYSIWGWIKPI